MGAEPALKQTVGAVRESRSLHYDPDLHERFVFWMTCKGISQARIASMIGRSGAAISQYVNRKFEGNLTEFEKDIASLLKREEDANFPVRDPSFCLTSASRKIWTVLQSCAQDCDMGIVVGPAGCGKTATFQEFKRQYRHTILVTADVTVRSVGAILVLISKQLEGVNRNSGTYSALLQKICEHLKNSRRLLVVDEAHFLSWEGFEAVRKINDCGGVGVVFAGQEKLYEQMRGGRRAFQWDQIYSRIGVRCHIRDIEKEDVTMLVDNLCPEIDKKCREFLYNKAAGKGKFRIMTKLLQRAQRVALRENQGVSMDLLKEANGLLMI